MPEQSCKRKKMTPNEARRQLLVEKAMAALENSEDEFDNIGKVVAAKLRKMDQQQFLHADKLITDVLYRGLQNQLSSNTSFFKNNSNPFQMYNQMPQFHSSFSESDMSRSTTPHTTTDSTTDFLVNYGGNSSRFTAL